MRFVQWVCVSSFAIILSICGCGRGNTNPAPAPLSPPSALTYANAAPVYIRAVAIPANSPSNSGGAVASYAVSPALPAGLGLNASTGVISGTPTVMAQAAKVYTVTASNSAGNT